MLYLRTLPDLAQASTPWRRSPLPLSPCPFSSLFQLFLLVSFPFPAHNCPELSHTLIFSPSDFAVAVSFSLLPTCLHPLIMLSCSLLEELCQKCPLCAVNLPDFSRKIFFPALSLAAAGEVSPAEGRYFSGLLTSLRCLSGDYLL